MEPMKETSFPDRPWSKIAADAFHHNGKLFLLAIDFYSRAVEIVLVSNKLTAAEIETVARMKKIFSRHGIADTVVTDNGPQFAAEEFADFAQSWRFEHVVSSPHYPQANGEVEHAVQTIKNLMKKSNDDRVPWSSNVPQHPTAQWVLSCSAQHGKNAEDQTSMSP